MSFHPSPLERKCCDPPSNRSPDAVRSKNRRSAASNRQTLAVPKIRNIPSRNIGQKDQDKYHESKENEIEAPASDLWMM